MLKYLSHFSLLRALRFFSLSSLILFTLFSCRTSSKTELSWSMLTRKVQLELTRYRFTGESRVLASAEGTFKDLEDLNTTKNLHREGTLYAIEGLLALYGEDRAKATSDFRKAVLQKRDESFFSFLLAASLAQTEPEKEAILRVGMQRVNELGAPYIYLALAESLYETKKYPDVVNLMGHAFSTLESEYQDYYGQIYTESFLESDNRGIKLKH